MPESTEIEIRSDRLFDLFRTMVDCYSPSGKEEELTDLLEAILRQRLAETGCQIVRQAVDETRHNLLIASPGSPDLADIHAPLKEDIRESYLSFDTLWLGHIDTVPAFDIENYALEKAEGRLFGLGTADMKGGCAAMIEAFCVVAQLKALPPRVMLALVVGEEESGDGTRALLEACRFDAALVAEPTGLLPCLEHYGYVELRLNTYGQRRHAAMSIRGTNAIHSMLHCLLDIEEHVERDEPQTILNIRDLHSAESGFAVPDRCSASVDFHVPPAVATRTYAAELQERIQRRLWQSECASFEIEFPTLDDGFSSCAEGDLAACLKQVYERQGMVWNLSSFKSHSDANLLYAAGCQTLILGPGELSEAHTRDESVAFDQVVAAAELYAGVLSVLHECGSFAEPSNLSESSNLSNEGIAN